MCPNSLAKPFVLPEDSACGIHGVFSIHPNFSPKNTPIPVVAWVDIVYAVGGCLVGRASNEATRLLANRF